MVYELKVTLKASISLPKIGSEHFIVLPKNRYEGKFKLISVEPVEDIGSYEDYDDVYIGYFALKFKNESGNCLNIHTNELYYLDNNTLEPQPNKYKISEESINEFGCKWGHAFIFGTQEEAFKFIKEQNG